MSKNHEDKFKIDLESSRKPKNEKFQKVFNITYFLLRGVLK